MKKIASEKNYRIAAGTLPTEDINALTDELAAFREQAEAESGSSARYKSRKEREWEAGLNRSVLNGINLTLRGFGYCIKGPESGHCPGDGEYSLVKIEPYRP